MYKVVNSYKQNIKQREIFLKFDISKIAMQIKNFKETENFFFTLKNKLRCSRPLDPGLAKYIWLEINSGKCKEFSQYF